MSVLRIVASSWYSLKIKKIRYKRGGTKVIQSEKIKSKSKYKLGIQTHK
jgi:hypothetical protein